MVAILAFFINRIIWHDCELLSHKIIENLEILVYIGAAYIIILGMDDARVKSYVKS